MSQELTAHPSSRSAYPGLFKTGGAAAVLIVAIMIIQVIIFTVWPPPETPQEYFDLFNRNWLLGLLSLDLLYILNNTLLIPLYLALYMALRRHAETPMLIGLILGIAGIAAYYASNTCFEMLTLSRLYAGAAAETQRTVLLGAGQALLTTYKGTAFDIYYVLNAILLLVFSIVMLRSPHFSRATAIIGIADGLLMSIPSTAGTLGMVFALASLVPWAIFSIMVARQLFQLEKSAVRA